ncbi:MAG: D-amino-acid dehydrogenase [Rhodothermaceae bacterium]|nr:MAG: D-amino-acid dehydrogenase [Rhodothermaceae bacterium]
MPDVIVVGAGAVGLCTAYFLREEGFDVAVVAREPVGTGASAGNAGMIVPSHVVPLAAPGVVKQGLRWLLRPDSPFYLRPRADLALARWLWTFRRHGTEAHVARSAPLLRDLSLASVELFEALQADLGDVGYAQTGLLMLFHTEKGRRANLEAADLAERCGLRVERLDAGAVREREPALRTPATGAVLYHDDGRVDPDAFLRALATTLEAQGVTLHTGRTVTGLLREGGIVAGVQTDTGALRAPQVVLAAGAWSGRLVRDAGLRLPLQPALGYSLTVPAPDDGPRLPMILTEEKLTVTPMPGRLRFAGTLALVGFDARIDPRRVEPLRRLARTYAPDAGAPVWAGFRPCSPDGLPYLGPVPGTPGLFVATGHGMMGLTLAPISGKAVATLLAGIPPPLDLAPFAPDRFA